MSFPVAKWLVTCTRKLKVLGSSPTAIYEFFSTNTCPVNRECFWKKTQTKKNQKYDPGIDVLRLEQVKQHERWQKQSSGSVLQKRCFEKFGKTQKKVIQPKSLFW